MRNNPVAMGLVLTSCLVASRAGAAPPAPYSLPWQLRPAAPVHVVRSDTTIAAYEQPDGKEALTVASLLLASFKVTPSLAPFVRVGGVFTPDGAGVTNLATGGTLALDVHPALKLALFAGLALPVGSGGGDAPNARSAAAVRSGALARSAMDNAMFAVNDVTFFPGIDVAYVARGLTVQAEATLLSLVRARGEAVQPDTAKVNFTSGLHVGYFLLPQISAGAELRYQVWLSTPAPVAADRTGDSRENVTFAIGPRFHFRLDKSTWIRPGIAYARGLDLPMSKAGYDIVQVDVPIVF